MAVTEELAQESMHFTIKQLMAFEVFQTKQDKGERMTMTDVRDLLVVLTRRTPEDVEDNMTDEDIVRLFAALKRIGDGAVPLATSGG